MSAAQFNLSDEHPVSLELKSLRSAVATFQHEAYEASVKLQKYSLDSSRSFERTRELESENARLQEEIAVLRENPDISPHPDSLQVQELTLEHRRLSDQVAITEATLELRTTELTNAQSELSKAKREADGAFALASQSRSREEDSKLRERELERKAQAAEEERRLADLVVSEYADLVRSLEGRRSILPPKPPPKNPDASDENLVADGTASTSTLVDSYTEGKKGLQKLLSEFNVESERLEGKISKLEKELSVVETKWEAERKTAELDRSLLAKVQAELVKMRVDDKSAARMVSRYMQFSQYSTNTLQHALDTLKTRHTSSLHTLNLQIDHLQISLSSERRQSKKLKSALDDLSEDISRETYGRRREVSLRLALLLREASVAEGLQRWSRKARELFYHSAKGKGGTQASFEKCVEGAEALLRTLNGDAEVDSGRDAAGSVARILAAQEAVAALVQELHVETGKRMELERQRAEVSVDPPTSAATEPSSLSTNQAHLNGNGLYSHTGATSSEKLSDVDVYASGDAAHLHHGEPISTTETSGSAEVSPAQNQLSSVNSATNGISNVVGTAQAAHTPSPSLLTQNFTISDDLAPMREAELENIVSEPQIDLTTDELESPEDSETQIIVASVDVVHQPTPRPRQDVSFVTSIEQALNSEQNEFSPSSPSSREALEKMHVFSDSVPQQTLSEITKASIPDQPQHSILSELEKVRYRYDNLQRSFRDCHLTLKDLKKTVTSIPSHSESVTVLRTAIQRLDDFNEDVRVEVEIRITDEELATRGYQTLLAVPGAISDDAEQAEVESQIKAFVDGTEKSVFKAAEQLTRKLDDLQHDVALLKKALHELPDTELQRPRTPPTPASWSSWTTNILSAGTPRSVSPAPPTFGTVMTSPRLRHSSSFTQLNGSGRRLSSASDASQGPRIKGDPFAELGLRIPMPSHAIQSPGRLGVGQPPSRPGPRPRTLSNMYSLGLGSRSSSLAMSSPSSTPTKAGTSPGRWSHHMKEESAMEEDTGLEEEGVQTDVE